MVASLAELPVPPDVALQPRRFPWGSQLQTGKLRLREVASRPGSHSQSVVEPRSVWLNHGAGVTNRPESGRSRRDPGPAAAASVAFPERLTSVFPPVEWGCVAGVSEEGQLPGRSWLVSAPPLRCLCPAPGLPRCFGRILLHAGTPGSALERGSPVLVEGLRGAR